MRRSSSSFHLQTPLLVTNLQIPSLPGDLVSRQSLLARLDLSLNFPLTLLSAPAGFGKTTLLSQWIAGSGRAGMQNRTAWVSVDQDCEVAEFWRYAATALEMLQPGTGQSSLALLAAPQPPILQALRVLVNALAVLEEDLVLIIDDCGRVEDAAVHDSLAFFIDHLPSNVHLILASRSYPPLPLARWRAGSRLYELREEDLRFTAEEMAIFLNQIKHLNLTPEEMAALGMRTEGWIAGLQLVALSLQAADEASKRRFIADFTGSQRYVLDYLVEEVLDQQPETMRTFLLQTAVVERLTAALCNALTGQKDGQAVLEHLERANMFTIPLDQERRWYRYHHLFLDVLRHRLHQEQSENVAELHRRAAGWYAQSGQTEDAIPHACAAQEWGQAIELIEQAIRAVWNRGEIGKIINWLGNLPDEHLDAYPQLFLYYSRALLLGGQMDVAELRLRESEKTLRARLGDPSKAEDRLLLGAICAFRTTVAAVRGETASALALGHEALRRLPPENLDIRAHTLNSLGVNDYYRGEMSEAARACAEAGSLAVHTGNLYLAMVAATYRAKTLVCQGGLSQAGQILEQALDLEKNSQPPVQSRIPAASVVCSSYGVLLYEWNRLEEAERILSEAIELGQSLAFGSALWYAYHTLARVRLAQGDRQGAETLIEQALMYRLTYTVPLPARLMDAEQARANLALGRFEAAERWAATIQSDRPESPGFVQEVENMTLARYNLLRNQSEQALSLLERLRPVAESSGRRGHLIEILALIALAQRIQGDTRLATHTMARALRLAEPEGYLRTFADEGEPMAALLYQVLAHGVMPEYVTRLLAIFKMDTRITSPSSRGVTLAPSSFNDDHLIEPLSERELEVLRLIAAGASNQEIAEILTITVTTAKKHVSNIIQKLGVDNRTQAATKGRKLNLCE